MKTETQPWHATAQVAGRGPAPLTEKFWSTAEIEMQSYLALSAARALMHERTPSGVTSDDFLLYMRIRKVDELVERYIQTCRDLARETTYLHRRVRRLTDDIETDPALQAF